MMNEKMKVVPFQIVVTLECPTKCKDCNQHLDVIDWSHMDTNITVSDIRYAGDCLHQHGMLAGKRLRITGGEPTIHPDFVNVVKAVQQHWRQKGKIQIYTFKRKGWPKAWRDVSLFRMATWKPRRPFRISPADLGIEVDTLGKEPCHVQKGCGGGFSRFGFSPCPWGGTIGGLLGMDVFSTEPILTTIPELCRHCICSLPTKKQRLHVQQQASDGEFPYPTKTFKRGIKRWRKSPFTPKTLEERLPKAVREKYYGEAGE